jgi:tRNA U34 2-thiouridine synthase MnmA/TrmU
MTAVEFLESEMQKLVYIAKSNQVKFDELFEQAKEMEKEQIVTAHYQGYRNDIGTTEVSEQYYNEIYNHKSK